MNSSTLTQTELLALALEATRRGDAGRSLAYLKDAAAREDATAQVLFLLGSEYAQIGLRDEAMAAMQRAVDTEPGYAIARFQLGLLHLAGGQADQALQTWAPLEDLSQEGNVQVQYLQCFHRGMRSLIRDEFDDVQQHLAEGMALNSDNPALNANMKLILDDVAALSAGGPASATATEPANESDADEAANHLLVNVYTRGKPH
jgi:tetratricopeptide (TPR) repeat protein